MVRMRATSASLGGLPRASEPGVAGFQGAFVGSEAGDGGHVEGAADLAAAALDDAAVLAQAAVLGDGGEAGERRDLAPVEGAELGQLGEQVAARIGPQPGMLVSRAASAARVGCARIRWRRSWSSSLASCRRTSRVRSTLARTAGLCSCSSCWRRTAISSRSWRRQARISRSSASGRVGQRCRCRAHHLAIARDQPGVDPVGLSLQADAAGEVAHALRVDDRGRHTLRHQPDGRSARSRPRPPSPPDCRHAAPRSPDQLVTPGHHCRRAAGGRWRANSRRARPC